MRMSSISAAHPQVGGSGDGFEEEMAPATLSSTQKTTSHLSSRVPFVLDSSVAIFWCEGLG